MSKQSSFHEALSIMPQGTMRLFNSLSDLHRAFIENYFNADRPSMQSLKLFIEKVCDFAAFINLPDYNKTAWLELTDTRSAQHIAADQLLKKLKYAKSLDNFESGQLQWSFTAKNMVEYKAKLQKLLDDSDTVAELFKSIGRNTLS